VEAIDKCKRYAKAVDWAIRRDSQNGGDFLAVNIGSDEMELSGKGAGGSCRRGCSGWLFDK